MRRRLWTSRWSDDSGVMLLMVLVFVMVVGLALAALLPYTQVGISEAGTARDVRSTQNAVDGAMQGAIADVRADLEEGNERSGRCDPYNAASYPAPVGAATVGVTVTCQNVLSGGGGPGVDVPPYAIVTTAGNLDETGNHALSVDGGIYVTGDITTTGGSGSQVVVLGDAYSTTATCGKVFGTGRICPTTSIPSLPSINYPSALGVDAAAAATTIGGLIKDPLGTCASNQSVVTFVPGFYSEPPSLGPSCASNTSKIWWFSPCTAYPACVATATSPGIYYFNFPDASYGPSYSNAGGSTSGPGSLLDLDKDNTSLVGGTLINSWDSNTTKATMNSVDPGKRCDQSKVGVQVVLGGPARIKTGNSSEIELCASQTSATSLQRIAIYGLSSSFGLLSPNGPQTEVDNAPNGVPAAVGGATTAAGDTAFRDLTNSGPNPGGARVAGDALNVGRASFNNAPTTYRVTLTNFPEVTGGALVSDAFVDVTHLETHNGLNPVLRVTYSSGKTDVCNMNSTNSALPIPANLTQAGLTLTRVNLLTGCMSNTLAKAPLRWTELNPDRVDPTKKLTITYEVQGSNSVVGEAIVDGVQLQTSLVPPAIEAERCLFGAAAGCVPEAYSNSGSSATDNTYFIGTVYTTAGRMNVVVHNSPNTIFQRGVVVASIAINANASSTQTDPPFQLPHSPVRNRTVLFTATTDGRVRMRALVHFIDCKPAPSCETTPNAPGNLVWPGKVVQIKAWTTLQ